MVILLLTKPQTVTEGECRATTRKKQPRKQDASKRSQKKRRDATTKLDGAVCILTTNVINAKRIISDRENDWVQFSLIAMLSRSSGHMSIGREICINGVKTPSDFHCSVGLKEQDQCFVRVTHPTDNFLYDVTITCHINNCDSER